MSEGNFSTLKYAISKESDPKCPNCGVSVSNFRGPCTGCGATFHSRTHRRPYKKKYKVPGLATMSDSDIKKFAESADVAYHTKSFEMCYAKKGETVRIHVSPISALQRCAEIILAPITGDTT